MANLGKYTLSGGVAHINVGEPETPFDIHVELLCDCSPYFDKLFKDRHTENIPEQPVCFPDEDPDVFSEFVRWMYRGELSDQLSDMTFLFRLWVLARKFEIPKLQERVVRLCVRKTAEKPAAIFGNDAINYVYYHTPPKSALRLLVVDIWVERATGSKFEERKDEFPREFLEDLCYVFIKRNEDAGKDEHGEILWSLPPDDDDMAQPATPQQMSVRKIKSPSSRWSKSSPNSSTRGEGWF